MFEAYQTLCGSTSSNSYPVYALEAPTNLDAPSLDDLQTYPGQQLVAIDTLANGSQVTIAAAGVGTIGLFSTPEALLPEFDLTTSGLGRPLQAGDQFILSQSLCGISSGLSSNAAPTSANCGALPAPAILPPLEGDTSVSVSQAVTGARVHVFDASGIELGDGSSPSINLRRAIECGDVLTVVQQVGACTSATGYRITVGP